MVYVSMKMKRKDLDEVNNEFSDFSLSSPARKIRRLDADLPPILEEEESPEIPIISGQLLASELQSSSVPVNEERSIVLFKPMDSPFLQSPSNFCVSVDSDIISGFKRFWSSNSHPIKLSEDEEAKQDKNYSVTNNCLAVVPWVPSQIPASPGVEVSQIGASEMVEAEEMEVSAMDIEECNNDVSAGFGQVNEFGAVRGGEGLPQWQQQHCMVSQLCENTPTPTPTPTPIVWYQ